MLCRVLKAFPYAHDHHHTVTLQDGQVVDIDDSVVVGLAAEGFIDEASVEEIEALQTGPVVVSRAPVEIPADWSTLGAIPLRKLAEQISGAAVASKAAATTIVEAELAKRAA